MHESIHHELEPYSFTHIAIIGAPCSGKSTVIEGIFDQQKRAWQQLPPGTPPDPESISIFPIEEAWHYIGPYNLFLRELLEEADPISPQQIATVLTETVVGIIESKSLDESGRFAPTTKEVITLRTIYDHFHLNFLAHLRPEMDLDSIKAVIQADLLRATIIIEQGNSTQASHPNPVLVSDGGLIYPILYLPEIDFSVYQQVFEDMHIPNVNTPLDVLLRYDGIVLLETLACLKPDEYKAYYYDGRRLDTPEHARSLHQRLLPLVKQHPNHLILPASESIESKTSQALDLIRRTTLSSPLH